MPFVTCSLIESICSQNEKVTAVTFFSFRLYLIANYQTNETFEIVTKGF